MGTLKIRGTIDLKQFWPTGNSDADTTKIKLQVDNKAFEYKKDHQSKYIKTAAFIGAISKGQGAKPVINISKRNGVHSITVRLQGVDAPELHYRASPLKESDVISKEERLKFNDLNTERRQCFAESATVALMQFLEPFANKDGLVSAAFETNVESPGNAIDTYGRFVGDIIIGNGHNINQWLVMNGWAFPTFYTSMAEEEIQVFLDAWKKGQLLKGRIAKYIPKDANDFDWALEYRKAPLDRPFKIGDDKGKVLMPKIFRRQNAWMVQKKAKIIAKTVKFHQYLKQTPDELRLLSDFLENGKDSSKTHFLHDFISKDNKISIQPEAIIFQEKASALFDAKGKKVVKW